MNYSISLKTICIIGLAGLILAPTLQAKPRASVKSTLTRAEDPRGGTKTALSYPMPFRRKVWDSHWVSELEQKVMVRTNCSWEALCLEVLTKPLPSSSECGITGHPFANRFFLSAQGMVGHYPKSRAYTSLFQQDTIRAGSNDSDMDDYLEDSGYDNWTDFKMEFVCPGDHPEATPCNITL